MKLILFVMLTCSIMLFEGCILSHQLPSPHILSEINYRGRLLYSYDVACIIATDTVLTLKPDSSSLDMYIAEIQDSSWTVAFGCLSDKRDTFQIAYKVSFSPNMIVSEVVHYPSPVPDTGFYLRGCRAIKLTRNDYKFLNYEYNYYVLPDTGNYLLTYFIPAQTKVDTFPLGGDVRYLVSYDGNNIIEKTQLHKSILETPLLSDVKAYSHIHVLNDLPVDTDLFYAFRQRPRRPHYIITKNYIFTIDPEGNFNSQNK